MATYDFEGMFGDRYSTEQAINDAMFKEAVSFGALDRTKYAPMTASSYGQAYMGSAGMAGLLGGQHPMMKRQNLLDEIKKKYPDPRTPAELYDLAKELSTNGFGDLSMQVRQVAMEMEKNESTKKYNVASLKKPSSAQLEMLPTRLRGIMGSAGIENKYLQLASTEDKNFSIFNPNQWGGKNNTNARSDWTAARERHIADIEQMVLDFANHKQGVAGWNIDHITAAIADDDALKNEFIAYIKSSSNRPHAKMLLDAMGVPTDTKDNGDGGLTGSTMLTDEQLKSNVEQRVKNLSLEEQQSLYEELEVKGWQPDGTFFLMREEAALYEFLKGKLGIASASWMD